MCPLRCLVPLALAMSAAVASAQPDLTEPGVTFRVYHIGYPMDRLHPLAPNQTPNIDDRRDTIEVRRRCDQFTNPGLLLRGESGLPGRLDH